MPASAEDAEYGSVATYIHGATSDTGQLHEDALEGLSGEGMSGDTIQLMMNPGV